MRPNYRSSLVGSALMSLVLGYSALCPASHHLSAQTQANPSQPPKEGGRNRDIALKMLGDMKEGLKEDYYDPKYRGIDLDARFKAAEIRIKTMTYNWQVFRVLAQVLLDFQDSHTRLIMPARTDHFEYGFSLQIIGDKCFVTRVKKGTDAEAKGLQVGDQILNIGKFSPTRENLWKIIYVLYRLDPIDFVDLKINALEGKQKQLTVQAQTMTASEKRKELQKRKNDEREKPFKCQEINSELIACKFYSFVIEKDQVDKMMKQVGQHPKLILDLRGNGGGYVVVEEYLTGYFFDHDVKIGELVMRKKKEERIAKTRKDKTYKGELVVLVDSDSASAAEVLARVIQIQKRGTVIGDVSKGAVMTSIFVPFFSHTSILNDIRITNIGMSMTIGDLIMSDGKRLENAGVIPDVPMVPAALALSQKTDPVLAYAAVRLGAELTPEKAGTYYFLTAKDEDESDADDRE